MKLLVDHNVNHGVTEILPSIFLHHEFRHAYDEHLHELKDIELFAAMSAAGYEGLITRDHNQLKDPDEKNALRSRGLHWIGYRAPSQPGVLGLALETATILAGLPYVLEAQTEGPTAFHLKAVAGQLGQRVSVHLI